MGEESYTRDYSTEETASAFAGDCDDGHVLEWEIGLPSSDDLTPLSQSLIPPDLASAFRIPPEPPRTNLEVHRASSATVSTLFSPSSGDPSEDSPAETSVDDDHHPDRAPSKRPRLVWTPQLHKRFVEVVAHLGIKNAMPKAIMEMMNVEGLTRENVASHLQKYRLYRKRMQGTVADVSPSSAPPPPPPPMRYGSAPQTMMIPMPFYAINGGFGMPQQQYGVLGG
ncbi:transcription factor BOA-like [Typha latifolia]|uniref:transcription factor BOA-like n=1 Tax=Typha latifolia TaxID=4733 RepID=UPI003C2B671C